MTSVCLKLSASLLERARNAAWALRETGLTLRDLVERGASMGMRLSRGWRGEPRRSPAEPGVRREVWRGMLGERLVCALRARAQRAGRSPAELVEAGLVRVLVDLGEFPRRSGKLKTGRRARGTDR